MKTPSRTSRPYDFLAALLLPATLVTGQTIPNPSFEADAFTVAPGTIAANGPIAGWTGLPETAVGLSPAGGDASYANNGAIPDGSQVAFLQSNGGSLSTTITGLTVGTTYQVAFRANASYGEAANLPRLNITVDADLPAGIDEIGMIVSRVADEAGGTEPYHTVAFDFTATAESHQLTLTNQQPAEGHTLLVDDFSIVESSGAWSTAHWTGDADAGVQNNYLYTHAYSFNSHEEVLINNVPFTGLPEWNNPPDTQIVGLPLRISDQASNLAPDSGSAALVEDFRYNTNAAGELSITLTGLEPDTDYVFSLYGMGWGGAGERASTFSSDVPGSGALTVDLNQFGDREGLIVQYTYTTDAFGSPVRISYLPTNRNHPGNIGNTFHTSAFSNREASPLAGAPILVTQPRGAAVAVGDAYTLQVVATGSDLAYQWNKGGAAIAGATSATLVWDNLTYEDAGTYSVTVSNGSGSLESETVELVVLDRVAGLFGSGLDVAGAPLADGLVDPHFILIANPDHPGQGVTPVYVQAQGTRPGAWLPNSAASKWVGPRPSAFAAAGIDGSDAGEDPGVYVYRTRVDLTHFDLATVIISGSWASDNGGLSIRVNGQDTGLANATGATYASLVPFVINSGNAAFVEGVNTIEFVVRNDEDNAPGSGNTAPGWTGLRVTGLGAVGELPPGTAPHITVAPVSVEASAAATEVKFFVGATGSGPLSYQWYRDGSPLAGETEPVLVISDLGESAVGSYHAVVTNDAGTAETEPAALSIVNQPPVPGEWSVAVVAGETVEIFLADLLGVASDPEGQTLTLTAVAASSALGGTVVYEEDFGYLSYTPPAGITDANDRFTYTLADASGATAQGTVEIVIGEGGEPEPGDGDLGPVQFHYAPGAGATLSIQAAVGQSYILQQSGDLQEWTDVEERAFEGTTPGALEFTHDGPPAGRSFYRIIQR